MKDSHLRTFAEKRLDSLGQVDQKAYPQESFYESDLREDRPQKISSFLKRSGAKTPNVLFEVKKASPTLGKIANASAVELCQSFVNHGAKAISVLVDPVNFGGHPDDLKACVNTFSSMPFLWKDFVLGEYQVRLAKHLGASSVLLMTQLLEDELLKDLFQLCEELKIEAFVETHTLKELEFALGLGAGFIGINARDFATPGLPIVLSTASELIRDLGVAFPETSCLVAQSGIANLKDLEQVLKGMPEGLPDAVQIGSSVSGQAGMPQDLKETLELV